jgi:NAD-dependent dihydropyrimidine dehydrogenase PreA subunit
MTYIDQTSCTGCGDCIETCPTGALFIQNDHAFIHQDLCKGCEVCVDSCPQGAIFSGEPQPATREVIQIPAVPEQDISSLTQPAERVSVREMIFPAIGAWLVWTGRELVPRLADLALGALDQRIQKTNSTYKETFEMRRGNRLSRQGRRNGHGRRRQRRRMKIL